MDRPCMPWGGSKRPSFTSVPPFERGPGLGWIGITWLDNILQPVRGGAARAVGSDEVPGRDRDCGEYRDIPKREYEPDLVSEQD